MFAFTIHLLEGAFLLGILGSAIVIVWVAIEDAISIRENREKEMPESTSRAAA